MSSTPIYNQMPAQLPNGFVEWLQRNMPFANPGAMQQINVTEMASQYEAMAGGQSYAYEDEEGYATQGPPNDRSGQPAGYRPVKADRKYNVYAYKLKDGERLKENGKFVRLEYSVDNDFAKKIFVDEPNDPEWEPFRKQFTSPPPKGHGLRWNAEEQTLEEPVGGGRRRRKPLDTTTSYLNRMTGGMEGWMGPAAGIGMLGGGFGIGTGMAAMGGMPLPDMMSQGISTASAGFSGVMGFLMPGGIGQRFKRIANSNLREIQSTNMLMMINNPGIQIEALIAMFMMYVSDRHEQKLRDKMAEHAHVERMEERRNQRMEWAGMLGPLAPFARTVMHGVNSVEALADGHQKSQTTLANELQILMHQWRQLTEMMSNIARTMHDMALTPLRNIR